MNKNKDNNTRNTLDFGSATNTNFERIKASKNHKMVESPLLNIKYKHIGITNRFESFKNKDLVYDKSSM